MINDEVEICLMEISPDIVKIGIKAPKNFIIHRKEIYDKIREEMRKAAESPLPNIDAAYKADAEENNADDAPNTPQDK